MILALPLSLLLIWFFLQKMAYFRVKRILINGKAISNTKRHKILGDDFNKDIYELSLTSIKKRLQHIYSVEKVKILKKYPNTLKIKLLDSNITAFIKYSDYKKKLLYLL